MSAETTRAAGCPSGRAAGHDPKTARPLASLRSAYPLAMIWFGRHTRRWWALVATASGDRLLEASTPAGMAADLGKRYPARATRAARLTRPQPSPAGRPGPAFTSHLAPASGQARSTASSAGRAATSRPWRPPAVKGRDTCERPQQP